MVGRSEVVDLGRSRREKEKYRLRECRATPEARAPLSMSTRREVSKTVVGRWHRMFVRPSSSAHRKRGCREHIGACHGTRCSAGKALGISTTTRFGVCVVDGERAGPVGFRVVVARVSDDRNVLVAAGLHDDRGGHDRREHGRRHRNRDVPLPTGESDWAWNLLPQPDDDGSDGDDGQNHRDEHKKHCANGSEEHGSGSFDTRKTCTAGPAPRGSRSSRTRSSGAQFPEWLRIATDPFADLALSCDASRPSTHRAQQHDAREKPTNAWRESRVKSCRSFATRSNRSAPGPPPLLPTSSPTRVAHRRVPIENTGFRDRQVRATHFGSIHPCRVSPTPGELRFRPVTTPRA